MRNRTEQQVHEPPGSGGGLRPPSLPGLIRAHRDYRLFWTGQMLASTGSWLLQSVLAYVVAVRFASPAASGWVAFCSLAPVVLVALHGGMLADRVPRRLVLRATALVQASLALAFAVVIAADVASLTVLCTISAGTGLAMGLAVPSSQSFVVDLVPRSAVPTAVAAASVQFNAARAIGPWFGGLLIAAQRLSTAFVLTAAAWLLQAINLHRIRTDTSSGAPQSRGGIREGVSHALRSRALRRLLVCTALVQLLGTPIITFLALYAEEVLDSGGLGYAALLSSFGVGAVVTGLLVPRMSARLGRPLTYVLSSGTFGAALIGFALTGSVAAGAPLLLLAGAGFVGSFSSLMTAQQLTVTPALRGRVASVSFFVSMGALPLGTVVQGLAAEHVGLPTVTMVAGALLCVQALVARVVLWRSATSLDRLPAATEVGASGSEGG